MNRTCIVCLPRTGSQLCSKLISNIDDSYILGEYFEAWNDNEYVIDENNYIKINNRIALNKPYSINHLFLKRLDLLSKTNQTQSLIVKLFLMDNYPPEILRIIIDKLHLLQFNFVSLTRNIKDQLLSYAIASSYHINFNKNVFAINSEISKPVYINLQKIQKTLDLIFISKNKWEENLKKNLKNVDYQNICYESIYEDLERIYNRKFNYLGSKSIQKNPLDLILNKEEILFFFKNKFNINL